jgi:RNA polymerase sigma factor (sigma-70 family)
MDLIATLFRRSAADPRPDGELLAAFLGDRDEPAFGELVRRHGPTVWGVCRRSLPNLADAEDAFQATFLVLVRRARRLVTTPTVGPWLFVVAVRTAANARRKKARLPALFAGTPDAVADPRPAAAPATDLDAILLGLPERYRAVLLMCYLEGLTHREAAGRLGCAEGTVSSLVSRGLAKLRTKFAGRGPAAVLAVAGVAVPAGVATATVRSAGSLRLASLSAAASPAVAALTRGVLRMFWVKKATAAGFAAVLMLAAGFGAGVSVRQSPQAIGQENPAVKKAGPEAEKLVEQLGDPDFKVREAAAKKLRDLGAKAVPALRSGTRDPAPEVSRRSRAVLDAVRADLRDALAKQFDPKKTEEYDHPVWKRFVAIAGDSRASRELFARVIANEKWLRTLDNAEADPAAAGHIYRVGIAEMFRDFHNDPAKSPAWPCDRPEEVAYLLLLGSYPDDNPPAKLEGDEIVPENLRNTEFLGRGIIRGEGQITHANGLSLGLDGKIRFFNAPEIVGAAGTDRVFARLFAAWVVRRDPSSEVVPRGFRIASGQRVPEVLPLARHYAANDFEPKRDVPPNATIAALELVAQFGTRADLPLFERHFGDETNVVAVDKPRTDGAMDYYRPAPLTETTQLRDVALGLALLLHGANPEDYGFLVRKDTFKQTDGRYAIPRLTQLHLGFESAASRASAFKKAKAWLAGRTPKAEPPAAPFLVLTVRGLGGVRSPCTLTEFDARGKALWSVTPGPDLAEQPKPGGAPVDPKNLEDRPAVIAAVREYLTRVRKDPNAPHDLCVVFTNDAQLGGFSAEALRCCLDAGFEKIRFTGYIPFGGFIPLLKPGPDGEAEGYKRYKGELVDTKRLLTDYEKALNRL